MGDTFVISGLKEKRSALAGRIVDLRREIKDLQGQLEHVDAVLRLYGLEPAEIPNKGRMPVRSVYFARTELSQRCRDMLRDKGAIRADAVAVQAMLDKGMDPEKDRKIRTDFNKRILVTLHDMQKAGYVEKIGHGAGVKWIAKEQPSTP